jgi:hypothetical protein
MILCQGANAVPAQVHERLWFRQDDRTIRYSAAAYLRPMFLAVQRDFMCFRKFVNYSESNAMAATAVLAARIAQTCDQVSLVAPCSVSLL